jgi:hypothetical protein
MKLLTVGLLSLAACAENVPTGTAPGSSPTATPPRIDVMLTDAPGAFDAVWVNISSVSIESADAGWLTLSDQMQSFDLLELRNDVTAALGGATLAAGEYGQLRLVVDSASVVVGGVESALKIASGMETGVKINLDEAFEDNMTYSITLDYDAAKSVKTTGQGYLMSPVISVKDFVAMPTEGEGSGSGETPIQ